MKPPGPAFGLPGGQLRAVREQWCRARRYNSDMSKPVLSASTSEVTAEIGHWLAHLGAERRMSPKTVIAYERDVRQFLNFLALHSGGLVTLAGLDEIAVQDVRAFMAHRRSKGVSGRSLMRSLSGVRSFARFLEQHGKGHVGALAAVRTPRKPR